MSRQQFIITTAVLSSKLSVLLLLFHCSSLAMRYWSYLEEGCGRRVGRSASIGLLGSVSFPRFYAQSYTHTVMHTGMHISGPTRIHVSARGGAFHKRRGKGCIGIWYLAHRKQGLSYCINMGCINMVQPGSING